MRKNLLGISAVGIAVVAIGCITFANQPERQFVPREAGDVANEAAGAMAYLNMLRANQVTGKIDQKDVREAVNALNDRVNSKTEALGLSWEAKGPDNQGGRTRDIIIDNSNSNILYAASVAGGVFKSTNAGLSWQSASNGLENLATVSLAQAPNGDLYVGTGENMFAPSGPGTGTATSPGMTGGGMYKSTDGGANWVLLTATEPPAFSFGNSWSAIGAIAVDPVNSNRIYAGTFGGLMSSNDGGTTWTNAIGQGGVSYDVKVGTDGSVWTCLGNRTFYSANGDSGTFTEISKNTVSATDLPRSSGRQKYAISKQDPNVIYCVQVNGAELKGLYRTGDKGVTWELIQEKTTLFDPLCASQCQGYWDLLMGVDPADKDHVFLGGVTIWEWKRVTGWRKVDGFGPFDIHSDKHEITWDPNNSNIIYVTTDGGIHKSSNAGFTWQDMNKNYITTQFYHIGIGEDRTIVGGTQDNGSWVLNGEGNTANTGFSLGPVGNFSGDGGFSLVSWLDNTQYFTEYQGGRMGRSENSGESFTDFFDGSRMFANGAPGSGGFSGWMMPFYLYETINDPLSQDSVAFKASPSVASRGFANGAYGIGDTLKGILQKPQEVGIFETSTFKVTAGTVSLVSDALGNLTGDGYGTFDALTGTYNITFNSSPFAEIIISCDVRYTNGSVLKVQSNINGLPFDYQLTQDIAAKDSIVIQDPVQSVFVAGLKGGLWMTRMAHNWLDKTVWWKVAEFNGTPQSITMSDDGNYIWAGTEGGSVVRVSNVNEGRSEETADVQLSDISKLKVSFDVVETFSGRAVTNIAVDPNNPDRVAITLGNYGNTAYIYYSTNATSANPTFVAKQGDLPKFPVYAVTFDKGNASRLIIGTEYGIFTTDDISAGLPTWTEENNGMYRVPVFTLTQYRTKKSSESVSDTLKEGDIFAGTHARGIFVSNTLQTARPLDVKEETLPATFATKSAQLQLFPNPAVDFTTVELNLTSREDVTIFVRDMSGKLVKQVKVGQLSRGKQEIRINTTSISSGTYLVTVQAGDKVNSGRFVVAK